MSRSASFYDGIHHELQADVHAGIGRYQRENGLYVVHPDTSRTVLPRGAMHALGERYKNAPPEVLHNDQVEHSYRHLENEIGRQFDFMTRPRSGGGMGIHAQISNVDPYGRRDLSQPYADQADLIMPDTVDDVTRHSRIQALDTNTTGGTPSFRHPDTNNMLRAVHDYFGHMGAMRGVDMHGEEAAYQSHASMFSRDARPALARELREQNAYLHHTGQFPDPPKRGIAYAGRHLSPAQFGEDQGALETEARREQLKQGLPW